ncbi:MAG TPA: DUF1631 family protein [Burkholderiaceae bacterium]|nr:DUF1631 family protein [Burkholderiaceae bacterium]
MTAADSRYERWRDLVMASVPALASDAARIALERLQGPALALAVAGDRQHTASLLPLLRPGPHGLAAAFSAALRQQLREEFAREPRDDAAARAATPSVPIDQLTLVDDQQIEEDIEVARVIQQVDTAAETDLRDLRALCATLRSASTAVPEVVPLRPDVLARALSRALQSLGLARPARLLALRVVGKAAAEWLATSVREQTRELERWGVEPLPYRLRVAVGLQGSASSDDGAMHRLAGKLGGASAPADRLIPRLLAQVAQESRLDPVFAALLHRLSRPALRSARADATVLTSLQHPLWRLVDRVAALGTLHTAAQAGRLATQLEPVLQRLERGSDFSPGAYERALAEIDELTTTWADSELAEAGVTVPDAPPAAGSLPTDWGGEGSLPTVPMALPGTDPHKAWVDGLHEGDRVRVFLHARWVSAHVAARSKAHVLLATAAGEPLQTIGRAALYRLHESGLATTIEVAAPVREAVQTLTLSLE